MAYGSNIPQWGQVNADFSNSSRMFDSFQKGLSNAGTIFGQLRASILEEEQRAVENAFREKNLSEQIRQFGITSGLDRDRLKEDIRYHDIQDANADDDRSQRATQAEMQHKAAMANVGVAQGNLALNKRKYDDIQALVLAQNNAKASIYQNLLNSKQEVENALVNDRMALASGSLNPEDLAYVQQKIKTNEELLRTSLSAAGMENEANMQFARQFGSPIEDNAFSLMAQREVALAEANRDAYNANNAARLNDIDKGTKAIGEYNTAGQERLSNARARALELFPDMKVSTIDNLLLTLPHNNDEWGSGEQKSLTWGTDSTLDSFNSGSTTNNKFYEQLSAAARDRSNFEPASSTATSNQSSTGNTDNVYKPISDSDPDYRTKRIDQLAQLAYDEGVIVNAGRMGNVRRDITYDQAYQIALERYNQEEKAREEASLAASRETQRRERARSIYNSNDK